MGSSQSNQSTKIIDYNKKLFIVIDLYVKPKFDYIKNFNIDNLKNNVVLKKNLINIIIKSLINKINYRISISENNLILINKKDNDNIEYLELNAIIEFGQPIFSKILNNVSENKIESNIEFIKLNILNEFYNYVSNKYGLITQDITLIILYHTLYNINIYQK
jgi:hypothetical protein